MAFEVHGIVQNASDPDRVRPVYPIEEKVARPMHLTEGHTGTTATMAEMVAAYCLTKLWAANAPEAFGIGCYVPDRGQQYRFIPPSGPLSELTLAVGEKLDDVFLGRG